jgi:hypothetical protein
VEQLQRGRGRLQALWLSTAEGSSQEEQGGPQPFPASRDQVQGHDAQLQVFGCGRFP